VSFLSFDGAMSRTLRASKIRGAWLAIVVDNKDGDGNPGYRVKVVFPWLNEQETSFWARIAVPMGGPSRGTYVLPEIDDQVLVVFEHGDIDRPIVVGALWSTKQEPVEVNQSGKNNTKLIKSRCGHRIIFDDKEGAEKITIVDKTKKNKIVLDSVNKVVKIESDGDIEVHAKASVILHANALKVGVSDGVTGKGKSLLTHAAKTFGLKASRAITIGGGNTTINVSNAAATSVSGAGAGELGGAAAETAKDPIAEHQHRVGGSGREGGTAPSHPSTAYSASTTIVPETSFIELELVDPEGEPVAFASYLVTGSDRNEFSGILDAKGRARVEGLVPGNCTVTFPELDGDDWRLI
jgi:phage baseplate assembly protein gpV